MNCTKKPTFQLVDNDGVQLERTERIASLRAGFDKLMLLSFAVTACFGSCWLGARGLKVMLEGTFFFCFFFPAASLAMSRRLFTLRFIHESFTFTSSLRNVACGRCVFFALLCFITFSALLFCFVFFFCNTLTFFTQSAFTHAGPKATAQNAYAVWRTEANEAHYTTLFTFRIPDDVVQGNTPNKMLTHKHQTHWKTQQLQLRSGEPARHTRDDCLDSTPLGKRGACVWVCGALIRAGK